MKSFQIAASILSADMASLADQVRQAEAAGVDRFHVDVMDGHFVPSLGFSPEVVRAVRKHTQLPIDVHLMVTDGNQFTESFASAGASRLIVHAEGDWHLHRTIDSVRSTGCDVGVAINPATSPMVIDEVLPLLDVVLIMTVNPGFGGQKFLPETLPKLERLRQRIEREKLCCQLTVDGGINADTAAHAIDSGADLLVAGSAIYATGKSIAESVRDLREIRSPMSKNPISTERA